jgi:pyrroloquinoline quinone biosynthesis protein B
LTGPAGIAAPAPARALLAVAAALAAAACAAVGEAPVAAGGDPVDAGWRVVVLGIAQDGGMPHLGCGKGPCAAARRGERRPEKVACLGITDGKRGWLLDATPDLPAQVHALGVRAPEGIFLTHAHVGHYAGLVFLGKEVLGAKGVPLYATERMRDFLSENHPWRRLVQEGRVVLRDNASVDLGGVRVSAIPVPHRDELSDTVAYLVEGPRRRVLFLPDIDSWEKWERPVREVVGSVDLAFLDACFWSTDELGNRVQGEVPHPPVVHSMELLEGLQDRVRWIHLNHTNPLLEDPSPSESRGFRVAREGEEFGL